MPDDDDDPVSRDRDQQEASESRIRKLILRISSERRGEFWLRLGFDVAGAPGFEKLNRTLNLPAALGIDVNDPADIREKREALAWAVRAQKRAATFGTRLLAWITGSIAIAGGLLGILKYLQDWRGH